MISFIDKYNKMSFEEKTLFSTKFSIIFNAVLALGKCVLAIFNGIFFFVAGVLNIFFMISKLECYLGVRYPEKKSFTYRNTLIGLFLLFAGVQYGIYMARLLFTDVETMKYGMIMGISIATISFVEMGIAIKGLFNSYGKGHYFRNIKIINFCSALTAIVLTEVALMSFAYTLDSRVIDATFGLVCGGIIVLIAIFIFIAPRVSLVDREHNVYKAKSKDKILKVDRYEVTLTCSKFYGNYYYVGAVSGNIIDGHIIKGRNPFFKWNIWIKITVLLFSEILIFPYAVGALVFYFKNGALINKLDKHMSDLGYEKVVLPEEEVVV